MKKEKTLVFILKQQKDDSGTITEYNFVGDKDLEKQMEIYFVEKTLNKLRYV